MKNYFLLMMILASIFLFAGVCPANLIQNGDFETGDFTGWTQSGNTGFTGVDNSNPHTGNFAAFLGSIGSDGVLESTQFAVTPGISYLLTFWLASDGGTPNDFTTVMINGSPVIPFSLVDIPNQPYTEYQALITPVNQNATNMTLAFFFRNDPGYLYLDDVSVNAVPEPTTMLLFGSGLGLVYLARRKMKTI